MWKQPLWHENTKLKTKESNDNEMINNIQQWILQLNYVCLEKPIISSPRLVMAIAMMSDVPGSTPAARPHAWKPKCGKEVSPPAPGSKPQCPKDSRNGTATGGVRQVCIANAMDMTQFGA